MRIESEIKGLMPRDKLSDKIWQEGKKMKSEIREKLLVIAEEFTDYLGVALDVLDVTMTGSYANYNYTKYSDIDLHIIVSYDDLSDVEDLASEFFNAKKSFWNDRHDIKIKGIEVELYAQDEKEPHSSTGVYSVRFDKWIVEPKKFKTEVDTDSIKRKYKKLEKEVDIVLKDGDYSDISTMLKKIKKMRQSGLDSFGELSDENLVYKILRNSGDLQKLFDKRENLFDINLSIK